MNKARHRTSAGRLSGRLGVLLALLMLSPAALAQTAPAEGTAPAPQVTPPRLVEFVEADYPEAAKEAGLEGRVGLAMKVGVDGSVEAVEVIEPAGDGFDEAAVAAAKRLRFEPARLGDAPVAVVIRFTYRFELKEELRAADRDDAASQEPNFVGRVLLRGRRTPVSDVGVQVDGERWEAVTGLDGSFALRVEPGTWPVAVVHPGYEEFATEETIGADERVEATYYVEARSRSRYRSVVRTKAIRKAVTRTSLEQVELVRVPGTFGEPFRVVQSLPGVSRPPFGLGLVIVRGAAPEDTGYFLDGFEIPALYHLLSGPAVFQSDLIGSMDFYPGGFPVDFGRKLAGAVAVRTKDDDREDRVRGKASVDLLDVEALVKVPVGEESMVGAAVRRSHFDLLVPRFAPDVEYLPRYWDYQLLGTTRLAGGWKTRALLFGSFDTLDFQSEPEGPDDPGSSNQAFLEQQFHRLQIRATRPVLDGARLELGLKAGWRGLKTGFNEFVIDTELWEAGLRAELRIPFLERRVELRVGGEADLSSARASYRLPASGSPTDFPTPPDGLDAARPLTVLETRLDGLAPAAWAELQWTLGRLRLIPGLRLDVQRYGAYRAVTLDPRLVARLQLSEWAWLKGGVGIFHQPPVAQALDEGLGSPESLTSPWALQHSLGTELQLGDAVELDLTGFYNSYRDLALQSRSREEGGRVAGEDAWVNDGEGRAWGMELLLRHRPQGPFFGWIAYTLSRSERRRSGDEWAPYAYDQTHILTAVGSVRVGTRWTFGLKFQLVSGNPRTPVVGSVYDADRRAWTPILGAPLSERNPTFHQLDLRAEREFLFDRWRLTAYLDVINVYNRANAEFTQFNYDYSESGPVPGLPIIPSLGVKGEF